MANRVMWMDGGRMWQKITIFERCEIRACVSQNPSAKAGLPEHIHKIRDRDVVFGLWHFIPFIEISISSRN